MGRKKVRKFTFWKFLLIILLFVFSYMQKDVIQSAIDPSEFISDSKEFDFTKSEIKYGLSENISNFEVVFCPLQNCYDTFYSTLENAQFEIKCALHEFDDGGLSKLMVDKSREGTMVEIVIDGNYEDEEGLIPLFNSSVKLYSDGDRSKLMHHKFCIIDDRFVLSGSTNPTENGFFKNNNNILVFDSKYLSQNFENEFDILASGKFGGSKSSVLEYNNITLINDREEITVSTYMCPRDDCKYATLDILEKSKEEILFANFVLTLNEIESLLVEKSNEGVLVRGIIENRMWNSLGSVNDNLSKSFDLVKDTNPNTMHHKVFVVDSKYVITGSMNPSASGTKYNDENLIIIESENIAKLYRNEILGLIDK